MLSLADVYPAYSHPAGWGDKGTAHDYLPTYEREITRRTGVTLLEIGVYQGHSIAMWSAWLTDSTVIGIDINLALVAYPDEDIRLCDGTDAEQVAEVLAGLTYDYVIDDGSHNVAHQLASLDVFLPLMKPGGRYFIEDIVDEGALALLVDRIDDLGLEYDIYDGRGPERQPDELLITIHIPE